MKNDRGLRAAIYAGLAGVFDFGGIAKLALPSRSNFRHVPRRGKKRRHGRPSYSRKMRGYDGTMYGPFRQRGNF